jgi:hypothetical protein
MGDAALRRPAQDPTDIAGGGRLTIPGGPVPLRISSFVLIVIALAVCAATAQGAQPRASAPGLVHQGDKAAFRIPVFGVRSCSLAIRYASGATQRAGTRAVVDHFATWTVAVPPRAALGVARWTVTCGAAGRLQGTFAVVRARSTTPGTPTAPPKVVVDKQGFSQRSDVYGTGSLLSFGLMLRNTSAVEDATSVYVVVNMVDAAGVLVGTVTHTVALVGAAGTFGYGDSLHLRTQVPVSSLELTIRVGSHAPKKAHPAPDFANVRLEPDSFNPGWVGEVDGEVVNATPTLTLANALLSIVVLDAAGNVIGGGTGATFASVPSGARIVFTATSGFSALPTDRAATAVISSEPTYTNGI